MTEGLFRFPFQTLYVFFIIHHGSREIVHARVTKHPSASWTDQQIVSACDWDREPPRYLIPDRDGIYGDAFNKRVTRLRIRQVRTPDCAPKANAYVERLIGSIRGEVLDHVLVFNEQHLKRLLSCYLGYYHRWRTHRSLDMDTPKGRAVKQADLGVVMEFPAVHGLHHYYLPKAA